MKLLIVDDEAPARQWLRHLIQDMGSPFEIAGEAATGAEAVAQCGSAQVDVVLMDIRMPDMDGLDAAGRIAQMTEPPAVIFTTAYEEHALEAFDQQAVDYLLKPVRGERLGRALARARVLSEAQLQTLKASQSEPDTPRNYLCVRFRGGLNRIPVEEILYFRADNKYVVARHQDGEVLLEESLKTLEQEFGDRFLRIHRNALIGAHYLAGLIKDSNGQARVCLQGIDERLEISRRHLPALRRWLKQGRR